MLNFILQTLCYDPLNILLLIPSIRSCKWNYRILCFVVQKQSMIKAIPRFHMLSSTFSYVCSYSYVFFSTCPWRAVTLSKSSGSLFWGLIRNLTSRWSKPETKKMMARIIMMSNTLGLTLLFKLKISDWILGGGGGIGSERKYGCEEGREFLCLIPRKKREPIFSKENLRKTHPKNSAFRLNHVIWRIPCYTNKQIQDQMQKPIKDF